MDQRYIIYILSEKYNCQMNELDQMFQAGVEGISERSELILVNIIIFKFKVKQYNSVYVAFFQTITPGIVLLVT